MNSDGTETGTTGECGCLDDHSSPGDTGSQIVLQIDCLLKGFEG